MYSELPVSGEDNHDVMQREHMVVTTTLLAVLVAGLLSGCGGKAAEPGAPQDRQQKDTQVQSKENSGSGTASPAGNIAGENATPPPK